MMDAQRIKTLLDLCAKATPPPWEMLGPFPNVTVCVADPSKDDPEVGYHHYDPVCECGKSQDEKRSWTPDAEFIAAARLALPESLRELSLAMEVISTDRDFVAELEQKDKALASWQANAEEWQRIDKENRQEIERLRTALRFVADQEDYTFAECSLAERIVSTCKAALGEESQ